MLSADVRDLLALQMADGLGPARISALLQHFGTATRVRAAGPADLRLVPGIGPQLAASLPSALRQVNVDAEAERIEQGGARVLVQGQPEYPPYLAEAPSAPVLLFVRGHITPGDARAVALVGTRHPTAYGRRMARRLAEGLARAGVCVVSGLARGIDGISHRGALDAGGRTLAVLAGGLQRLYPPEHRGLADEVARSGAVLTESTMDQEPLRGLFPARNRIISGLSRVVVIVQAPAESGALITAEHAAEQGRTVMAVPGLVDEPENAGCHRLLREGAVLCRDVEDVLEELDGVSRRSVVAKAANDSPAQARPAAAPPPALTEPEQKVWELLAAGARAADVLAQELGLAVPQLSGLLLRLEMRKVIRRLPGNRYERA